MIDALVKSTDVKSQPSNFTSVKWLSAKLEEVKSTFIIFAPLKSVSLKSTLPFAFLISVLNDSISVCARLTNSSFDNIVLLTPS